MEPELLEAFRAMEKILKELIFQVLPGTTDPKALVLAKECVRLRKAIRVMEAKELTKERFPNS